MLESSADRGKRVGHGRGRGRVAKQGREQRTEWKAKGWEGMWSVKKADSRAGEGTDRGQDTGEGAEEWR
jgi:hypothetical protein